MSLLRTWTPLLLKVAFVVAALVVFAWVGRSLAVRVVHQVAAQDAGALPVVAQVPVVSVASLPVVEAGAPPVPMPAPAPSHVGADVRATSEDPVYLNQASTEQLRRLPGVGPKRAEAILELRQRIGKFQRVEDLMRVKGIGRSTIRKWRPLLRIDTPRDAGADATAP